MPAPRHRPDTQPTPAASDGSGGVSVKDLTEMFEAHVSHELARWDGAALTKTIRSEVGLLFGWLGTVRLDQLVTVDQVLTWIRRYGVELPLSDELAGLVYDGVRAGYDSLLDETVELGDLIPTEHVDEMIDTVALMHEARDLVIEELTDSSVYGRLVAHVLYHGIKSYLLTENVFARRIPGASSLVRMGQSALSSAAPSLEKKIDRQLLSFVNANVDDMMSESRDFLGALLDDDAVRGALHEAWASNANRQLSGLVGLLPGESLDELVEAGLNVWLHLRETELFANTVDRITAELFARSGERAVAQLIRDVGVTETMVTDVLADALRPALVAAHEGGQLEGRVRSRLMEFYQPYLAGLQQ